jgi:hypothetical protein
LLESIAAGDLILGDRYYGSYFVIAMLQAPPSTHKCIKAIDLEWVVCCTQASYLMVSPISSFSGAMS